MNLVDAISRMQTGLLRVVCLSWVILSSTDLSAQTYQQIFQTAQQSISGKKYPEAYDLARHAIGIDGSRWEAYDLAGAALVGLQRPSDALRYFQGALDRAPGLAKADIRKAIDACRTMINAAAGDANAMTHLGLMYETGEGVPRDDAQAVSWYRKAADAGEMVAMYGLGDMYENGRGVPKDYAQALSWYRKAAAAGSPDARESLRRLGQ
jgi:TPR repeat protein